MVKGGGSFIWHQHWALKQHHSWNLLPTGREEMKVKVPMINLPSKKKSWHCELGCASYIEIKANG